MYKITRDEAAEALGISTRSVDRYIKSGKLRAQKEGKIVYIHQDDIDNLTGKAPKKQQVITKEKIIESKQTKEVSPRNDNPASNALLENIYNDLKDQISTKDQEIKKLVFENGKLQEVVKSSISMIEFKKTQFLLEESKNGAITNLENTKKELEDTQRSLEEEKKLNYILIFSVVTLILLIIIIWVVKI